ARLSAAARDGSPYQVAIIDAASPSSNASWLAATIAANERLNETAVLFLTSIGEEAAVEAEAGSAVAGYLSKPITASRLFDALMGALQCDALKAESDKKENAAKTSAAAKSPPALVAADARLLLVEDNEINQQVATELLRTAGYSCDVRENGKQAVEAVQSGNYDLVLMDCQMPEMDGYEATRYIRNKLKPPKSNVPVVAMTAHAISGEEDKCYKIGMNGYISKPFNPQNLYNKVAAVLSNGHAEYSSPVAAMHNGETNGNGNGNHKHIDLAYLKKLANGSNEFIQQMITLFIEQTPGAINRMEKYLEEHNWDALGKVAHKMKPSVMFVGIKEIEKDVKNIEDFA
ncbi:MAG: response regulator, partial [Candidatus Saccharimonadales bacterium]